MTQLENLVNLEKNQDLLDKLNSQLSQLKDGVGIKSEKLNYDQLRKKLNQMEEAINHGKTKLRKSDYKLKDYELKLKELDEELYSGSITNEKQLNFLTGERERISELLESLETEILENMDIIGNLEVELNAIRAKVEELKDNINLKIKNTQDNIVKLEKAKIQLNSNIASIKETVDDNLIEKFEKIRKSKGSGISFVENGICSGCNIMVPNYQHEDIRRNRIVHCESCNRILYMAENNIEK